ncbi:MULTISPECIES: glycosyltransferase family 2 protein [Flavobacterium]|uniref:glycosyltransferase family 2 protein n=1 Tax=Flavobacterium TaxID=237 RepID=UPI000969D1F5|nr:MULTISPECIES: glycosyltransferase family 2 protein [Flavobacterium]MBN9282912.1 glycosyltransferase family 2 protein [Flavobacterium sp.]OJV67552.1 MAG: glycosyl transferase [Flavobacterium sp. 40-81]
MKVAGFTFIRNAVQNDYSIVEAITSILPICDEFVVAHGNSTDTTLDLIKSINSPKIRIIQTVWDDTVREGGKTFALETDKAFHAISPDMDWAFYIQGDECVHEKYLDTIKKEMEICLNDDQVQGLLFNYTHFYGSYDYYAHSRRWYRREIRVIRNLPGMQSYKDAQGFRYKGEKLKVKHIDASIYHYGWVKPPSGLKTKVKNTGRFYNSDDEWIDKTYNENYQFDYGNAERLLNFKGTHPKVFQDRVSRSNWKFSFDPTKLSSNLNFRRKFLAKIEDLTGMRLFEYKNYIIVKRS